jgi:hypothetical protein
MGLGDLEKPAEIWSVVVGKDGKEYSNLFKCNSIKQLEEEEPDLANVLNSVFQKWYSETGKEAAEKLLNTFGKDGGYSYKHTDGNTYKFSKYNGQLQLTKIKGSSWSGGGKKGYSYTFMRTEMARVVHIMEMAETLQNQGPTDNWKISKIAGESEKDFIFLMENQKQYTPSSGLAVTESRKDADKKDSEEDSEE